MSTKFQKVTWIWGCLLMMTSLAAQNNVPSMNFDGLSHFFAQKNDTTYVINFWATWCAPCVAEMPYFEAAQNKLATEKVKFIMVSLDMPRKVETSLYPFLAKNKVPGTVILLDDSKMNDWIPKVDPNWDGAIPVTYIYKGDKKVFIDYAVHSENELIKLIKKVK